MELPLTSLRTIVSLPAGPLPMPAPTLPAHMPVTFTSSSVSVPQLAIPPTEPEFPFMFTPPSTAVVPLANASPLICTGPLTGTPALAVPAFTSSRCTAFWPSRVSRLAPGPRSVMARAMTSGLPTASTCGAANTAPSNATVSPCCAAAIASRRLHVCALPGAQRAALPLAGSSTRFTCQVAAQASGAAESISDAIPIRIQRIKTFLLII